MLKKDERAIQFRPNDGVRLDLIRLANLKSQKVGRCVTVSEIIRDLITYGMPVLDSELKGENVQDVARKSHTTLVRETAIKALKAGISTLEHEHNSLPNSTH